VTIAAQDRVHDSVSIPRATSQQWIFFTLGQETYALPAARIAEMVPARSFHPYPRKPPFVAGVMTLREKIFPVVDLRTRLGMKSLQTEKGEMVALIDQRERDHVNWLRELVASVEEDRPFKLETNPHRCAFGRWYDAYEGKTTAARMILWRFDGPHKAIHALADVIRDLVEKGRRDEALARIQATKDREFAALADLFDKFRATIREEDEGTVLVHRNGDRLIGFLVDAVAEMRMVDPAAVQAAEDISTFATADFVRGLLNIDGRVRVLLDEDAVLAGG
jgi:chemotaxis signal transduction protein